MILQTVDRFSQVDRLHQVIVVVIQVAIPVYDTFIFNALVHVVQSFAFDLEIQNFVQALKMFEGAEKLGVARKNFKTSRHASFDTQEDQLTRLIDLHHLGTTAQRSRYSQAAK